MKAEARTLAKIFEIKTRLDVPLFQRQYVWEQEKHWTPLWEDISRKFKDYLDGQHNTPVHFLGAIVLEQKQTSTGHVERQQIIDGQQRLTTFQIFLAAWRDLALAHDLTTIASELQGFTTNSGLKSEPEDYYKVWPSRLDREHFTDVIASGSRAELETRYPRVIPKRKKKPEPRPRMVEAYLFFYDKLKDFFSGNGNDDATCIEKSLADSMTEALQALRHGFKIVVIDLEKADNPQVIFETLNARGEPLRPADLLRNYIFQRVGNHENEQKRLYDRYWSQFDDEFWGKEVTQGRIRLSHADLFMQHYLLSRVVTDVPTRNLFVVYKHWIEDSKPQPFSTVEEELKTMARQGKDFQRILAPRQNDPLYPLVTFLDAFEFGTAYPFLLALLEHNIPESNWHGISQHIESYVVRRVICGLPSQNFSRVFIALSRAVRRGKTTPDDIAQHLLELKGEWVSWPSDAEFRETWTTRPLYQVLKKSSRIVHILTRLNTALHRSNRVEDVTINSRLSVEYIMPRKWHKEWPLPDGSRGLNDKELNERAEDDPLAQATHERNQKVQMLGNLTIVTGPLNASLSNDPWQSKRDALLRHSLLPINQPLRDYETWDEDAIARRGAALFELALQIWPRPRYLP